MMANAECHRKLRGLVVIAVWAVLPPWEMIGRNKPTKILHFNIFSCPKP